MVAARSWLPPDGPIRQTLFIALDADPVKAVGEHVSALGVGLDVGPSQVVQLVEASDGRFVAEGAVGAAMVIGP